MISSPIRIGSSAWIAAERVILRGVTIGNSAIVAANSVVTKDLPAHTFVAGSPARVDKSIG